MEKLTYRTFTGNQQHYQLFYLRRSKQRKILFLAIQMRNKIPRIIHIRLFKRASLQIQLYLQNHHLLGFLFFHNVTETELYRGKAFELNKRYQVQLL